MDNKLQLIIEDGAAAIGKSARSLSEIETLRERDEKLEEIWAELEDVPMDPETERLEAPFMDWDVGTDREEILHWFDQRYSKSIAHLLYMDGIDRTDQLAKLVYLRNICPECESTDCRYNHDGECRLAMVHETKPQIDDEDGCADYNCKEEV